MVNCCAKGCENKQRTYTSTMFHRIPPNVERRNLWLAALGIPPTTPVEKINHYRVCEEHFTPEDYEEKMQYPTRKLVLRLMNTAVPSIFSTESEQNASYMAVRLNLKKMEIESSVPAFEQTDPEQRSTPSDNEDASISLGAGLLREAEEPAPQIFSTAGVKRRTISSGTQCPYCRYRCGSRFSFQIHIGSQHPLHCEDVCVGRLGKVVFYQPTAKLFHCHICFFTSKDYAVVFEHLLARHCFSARKAVQTDKGDEVTNELDPEIRHREGRNQDRSPNPEVKLDDDNTTDHHEQKTSNEDSLKRKRSSVSSGEDEDHINLHHRQELYQCPYCLYESSLRGLHQHLSQCKAVERNEDKHVGTEEKE